MNINEAYKKEIYQIFQEELHNEIIKTLLSHVKREYMIISKRTENSTESTRTFIITAVSEKAALDAYRVRDISNHTVDSVYIIPQFILEEDEI